MMNPKLKKFMRAQYMRMYVRLQRMEQRIQDRKEELDPDLEVTTIGTCAQNATGPKKGGA